MFMHSVILVVWLLAIGYAMWRYKFAPFAMMAAPDSYRADIPAEVNNFYDRVLLQRALPLNLHGLFGQRRAIPAKSGTNVIKFRRYGSLAAATTALTEGVTPAGHSLTVTDLTATALQFGTFTRISDIVDTQSIDAVLTEASEILGEQQGDTNDQLTRDILVAGTTVQYASSATSRVTVAAGQVLNLVEVKEAVTTLKVAKARKMTKMSGVNPGVGSIPIFSCFVGITHPAVTSALKALAGWQNVETYTSNSPALPGEIGKLDEVRFLETTNAKIFTGAGAAGIDVYAALIIADNAYGVIDLANSQSQGVIFNGFESGGSTDPLRQRQTLGWKEYYISKILNDAFMVRIEHALV